MLPLLYRFGLAAYALLFAVALLIAALAHW
jgi:hypothetical protein